MIAAANWVVVADPPRSGVKDFPLFRTLSRALRIFAAAARDPADLVALRAELSPAQNLNDGAVHRSMIAWAEDRWSLGHLPLDGWYPQLALGAVMLYCIWLILATGAFWVIRMWFLTELFEGVYQAGRWPDGIWWVEQYMMEASSQTISCVPLP